VFSWISWTESYDVTKIRPHITSFFIIHFGFENMSFALNIGKNAKPKNPGFCMAKTRIFGFGKGLGYPITLLADTAGKTISGNFIGTG